MISDNYGRKPAVVLGTFGTALGMLIFGTAKSYWQAVLGRIIGGVLCGNLGVVKSFLSEITDETNQGKGFAYISVAWSLGCLLAPLAGGLLCNPAEKYPSIFAKDGVFHEYPYLFPCLICVVNNVLTAILALFVMTETRKWKKTTSNSSSSGSSHVTKSGLDNSSSMNPMQQGEGVEMMATSTSGDPHQKPNSRASRLQQTILAPLQKLRGKSSANSDGRANRKGASSGNDSNVQYARIATQEPGTLDEADDLLTRRGRSKNAAEAAKFSIVNDDDEDDEEEDHYDEEKGGKGAEKEGGDEKDLTDDEDSLSSNNITDSPKHPQEDARGLFLTSEINYSEALTMEEDPEDTLDSIEGADDSMKKLKQFSRASSTATDTSNQSGSGVKTISHGNNEEDNEEDDDADAEEMCCSSTNSSGWALFMPCRCCHSPAHQAATTSRKAVPQGGARGKLSVLRQRAVVLATGSYGVLAMAYILFDETIPLFLKLDSSMGGLQFTSSQIGFLLSISGGAMLGFNYYFLPYLITKYGKKYMFELGQIGAIPFTFLWPILALVNRDILVPRIQSHFTYNAILWPILIIVCICKNVFACLSFTAVMLQINHSVLPEYLGAVNGLGQSLASLARAVGPALGGLLWSVAIQRNFVFLNFISVVAILLVGIVMNRMLPDSIDHKKKKAKRRKNRRNQHGEVEEEDEDDEEEGGGGMMMAH